MRRKKTIARLMKRHYPREKSGEPKVVKPVTALGRDAVEAEVRVIFACHSLLEPLDTDARYRVINWLQNWTSSERQDD